MQIGVLLTLLQNVLDERGQKGGSPAEVNEVLHGSYYREIQRVLRSPGE